MGLKRRIVLAGMLLICVAACCTGCSVKPKQRYQTSYLELFDTVTSVVGYEDSEKAFSEKAAWIHDELEAYDHLYDIYHEYPGLVNLRTINLHPGETFTVDQRIIDLLSLAEEADQFSGHRVNAMYGAVLRIWHEAREEGISHPENAFLPERDQLEAAAAHTGFDLIEINQEARTVRLLDSEASLDVGALAKGYAAQKVCESLPEGYLLSVGGNVVATGPKPDGTAWTVGVQNPDTNGEAYIQKVALNKGAVVTSGDYQRLYMVDGVPYHHIIDPETMFPGNKWRAVTVITKDSGLADALSTALFLVDQEEGRKLLERFEAEALWIAKDGEIMYTSGYEAYIKE